MAGVAQEDNWTFQDWLNEFGHNEHLPGIKYCSIGIELANLEILTSHDRTVPFNYDKTNIDYVIKDSILNAKN